MNTKTSVTILISVLILYSCGGKKDEFTISGKMINGQGKKVVLSELEVRQIKPLDSAIMGNAGDFKFSRKSVETSFYILTFQNERVILVTSPGEEIRISGNIKQPSTTYKIEGSENSILLQDFFRKSEANVKTADSILAVLKSHENMEDFFELNKKSDSALALIIGKQKKIQRDFINAHPESPAVLLIINFTLGAIPVFDEEKDYDLFIKTDSILYRLYPDNTHVQYHHMRVDEIKSILKMKKEMKNE